MFVGAYTFGSVVASQLYTSCRPFIYPESVGTRHPWGPPICISPVSSSEAIRKYKYGMESVLKCIQFVYRSCLVVLIECPQVGMQRGSFGEPRCACAGLGEARMNVCCLDVKICSFDHFVVANLTQQCPFLCVHCQLPVCAVCSAWPFVPYAYGVCGGVGEGRGIQTTAA